MFGHIIIHQSVYNYGSFGRGFDVVHCLRTAVSCEVDILPCNAARDIDKVIMKALLTVCAVCEIIISRFKDIHISGADRCNNTRISVLCILVVNSTFF